MQRNRYIYAWFLLCVVYCNTHFAQNKEILRPNFIVFYCDNLGFGDIEPFGSMVHRTPQLNRMAKEGRKFTHFYVTAGVCTPSRASIMTGCYAQRINMHSNERDGWVLRPISPYGLHPDEVTIAEVLKNVGYVTGIIGKWHLGDQEGLMPNDQGFDYFYGIPYSDDMVQEMGRKIGDRWQGKHWPRLPLMLNREVLDVEVDRNLLTKDYTEKTLDFIDQHKNEPFFLYLPQAMPGSTKHPFASPEFRGQSQNGPWGDSVEELDWSVGQIMDHLEKTGLAEQTLFIFTSDNGSPMGATLNSIERGTNAPLHGRGYTTAEGGFRVPTIMWWPGTIPHATVCSEMATTMDLLPTFANFAGAKTPTNPIDGYDISTLILGNKGATTPYKVFYYYDQHQLQAIRSGPWKLFLPLTDFNTHPHFTKGQSNEALLFNVVEDIHSLHNQAAANPEIVKQMMEWAEIAKKELGNEGIAGSGQRPIGKVSNPVPRLPNNN